MSQYKEVDKNQNVRDEKKQLKLHRSKNLKIK